MVDNLIFIKIKGLLSDNQNFWLKTRIFDRSRKGESKKRRSRRFKIQIIEIIIINRNK